MAIIHSKKYWVVSTQIWVNKAHKPNVGLNMHLNVQLKLG